MNLPNNHIKVNTVFQMEGTECGAASLGMILRYYDAEIPLERLRVDTGVTRDGCNAKNIVRGAKLYGLKGRGFRKDLEGLVAMKPPCIIHWNFNHFVIYEGCKNGYIYINDPGEGRRKLEIEMIDECFTGIVLSFEKEEGFKSEKKKNTVISFLTNRITGSIPTIVYLFALGIFLTIMGLMIPVLSQVFIDRILLGSDKDWFNIVIIALIIASIMQGFVSYVQQYYLLILQKKIATSSSYKFMSHLFKLPVEFYNQRYSGDLIQRISSNDSVANFLAGDLFKTVLNIFTVIFYLILLLVYSVKLTLIGLIFVILNYVITHLCSHILEEKNTKVQNNNGRFLGMFYSGISIIESLKAIGAENKYLSRILGYYATTNKDEQDLAKYSQVFAAIPDFVNSITDVLILVVGGLGVINGEITAGVLVAYQMLMKNFLKPINEIINLNIRLQTLKAEINRLEDVHKYDMDEKFKKREFVDLDYAKLKGYVKLDNITFGYGKLDPPFIKNFEFESRPGQMVAFVGSSGSGKSTMAKIISGLYQPWEGNILFDNQDYYYINPDIVTKSLSIVSQKLDMFPGTIQENITLWDKNIKEEEIVQAAKDACIHEVIVSKPGGYLHSVEENGSNFSGGQKQRLEIARALVTNPTILILDEATNALDPITESQILKNIKRRGCTSIIIAHRLSTIRDADEIIYMDNGVIRERGNHEMLKQLDGAYANLIKNIG
jgi:NHLM bacteriocin system ABC transporter peptidase/ATP-binding protein